MKGCVVEMIEFPQVKKRRASRILEAEKRATAEASCCHDS